MAGRGGQLLESEALRGIGRGAVGVAQQEARRRQGQVLGFGELPQRVPHQGNPGLRIRRPVGRVGGRAERGTVE